jgi:hypothetical protein
VNRGRPEIAGPTEGQAGAAAAVLLSVQASASLEAFVLFPRGLPDYVCVQDPLLVPTRWGRLAQVNFEAALAFPVKCSLLCIRWQVRWFHASSTPSWTPRPLGFWLRARANGVSAIVECRGECRTSPFVNSQMPLHRCVLRRRDAMGGCRGRRMCPPASTGSSIVAWPRR